MQKKNQKLPYLANLIKNLAPKIGARFLIEPEWKIAGQIIYPNGVVRSLRMYSLDLNHVASSDIARDKDYAKFFMKQKGYPVAQSITVLKASWAKTVKSNQTISYGIRYAVRLGFPVIVKPNSKSQGMDVHLVDNKKELSSALCKIFKEDRVALIEEYLPGKDYRIVVLDGEIISAYERLPLSVTGDGKNSILMLLQKKNRDFFISGRDTKINVTDPRIKTKLKKQKLSLKSILEKSSQVFLLENANLSTGGDSIDVTKSIHQSFGKIAAELTRDMGLRMAGVDIMIREGDIKKDSKKCSFYIIEINAAPGLDHYVTTGRAQRKNVEDMYLKILKALGKKD